MAAVSILLQTMKLICRIKCQHRHHKMKLDRSNNKGEHMLFMIIERFKDNDMLPIYQRVRDEGRMFPEGLKYIDSWVEPNFSRCFQLMECDDLRLLQEWILKWRGSGVTFEIIPVVSSKETQEVVTPLLDKSNTF